MIAVGLEMIDNFIMWIHNILSYYFFRKKSVDFIGTQSLGLHLYLNWEISIRLNKVFCVLNRFFQPSRPYIAWDHTISQSGFCNS